MAPLKRHAYDAEFKLKAISHAVEHGNRAAAREFNVNESMVRKWRKQQDDLRQVKKTRRSFRGNKARWLQLEDQLEQWVVEQRTAGRSVSTVTIRMKATVLARELNINEFRGGPSWCFRFMKRRNLSIRTRTTVSQQLPTDYQEKMATFRAVIMEGDEMEMSKEDLKQWIREEVHNSELISPDVLEKCNLLQSLLQKREKQAAHLLRLCESVAACEAVVKKQYSLLGWEYKDTDSDDDVTDCGHSPPSPCDSVHSDNQDHYPAATIGPTSRLPKLHSQRRKLVVVLTRLPECQISALQSSLNGHNDKESLNGSISDYKTKANKRKRTDENNGKPAEPQASTDTHIKSKASKVGSAESKGATTSPHQTSTNHNSKSRGATTATEEVKKEEEEGEEGNIKGNTESSASKTPSPSVNSVPSPSSNATVVTIEPLCKSSDETNKQAPPSVPQGEIHVNMNVLARRRGMNWQRGKIKEILTKEDGRVKYKINFVEKGKSLVSGHHIAFDCMPKVDRLFVGARVVVECQAKQPRFSPGILAELPNRRNRMRFLVFVDDHMPIYVGLPLLHVVCKPLTDPLDDISDETHKNFMKEYLKSWPYPPQTQYKAGQIINAEFNGMQEKCEVQLVDCSLIKVVFQKDQHKEWIYRGSIRLEHMVNMLEKVVQ